MEVEFYNKIEVITKRENGGTVMRDFENVNLSYIGNNMIITRFEKNGDITSELSEVFLLDNVIKFKCIKKC